MSDQPYDVLIVGAGPVGSTAASIAARHGLRCLLVDESVDVFPLPRAIHFDADIMRIFQFAGIAAQVEPLTRATTGGVHLGVDGEPIRMMRVGTDTGDLGWRPHYMFYQPKVDSLLRELADANPLVDTLFGWSCEGLDQQDDQVVARLNGPGGEERSVRGRYVIASDGASSPIREQLGLELTDYEFEEPWVIIDGEVPDEALGPDYTIMYCDPSRPGTYIPGPGRHRRWEFMLLPGETDEEVSGPNALRELIAPVTPWLDVKDLDVDRVAVYRFHALVAARWRAGRVFLAGDAAHQTPPFYGQGMCHGIRDVRNILWKIAAVLDGSEDDSLLDTYQVEREPHVRAIIEAAVANGRYICTLDPEVAAQRDRDMRAKMDQPSAVRSFRDVIPGLTDGLLDPVHDSEATGLLFVQPEVTDRDGGSELLDEVLGDGFSLVTVGPPAPGPEVDWFTNELGGRIVHLGADLMDRSDTVGVWMDTFGCVAAVVRPDRYVFGVATAAYGVERLLGSLRQALPLAEATVVGQSDR